MKMTIVGIDNGVSGSIGIISPEQERYEFYQTPTFRSLGYQKKVSYCTRINYIKLKQIFDSIRGYAKIFIERPMVNPGRFLATISAIRSMEATIIVMEQSKLGYEFVDSKEWQKEMLPSGIKGATKLKEASVSVATKLYPQHRELFIKQKDGDGMLIAEYYYRKYLKQ